MYQRRRRQENNDQLGTEDWKISASYSVGATIFSKPKSVRMAIPHHSRQKQTNKTVALILRLYLGYIHCHKKKRDEKFRKRAMDLESNLVIVLNTTLVIAV